MPDFQFKVNGLAELDKALQQLPEKLQRNVLRAALRSGAKEIAEEATRLVPVDSGDLRDTIRVTSRIRAGQPTATVKAGDPKKKVFYAHMIEHGTAKHFIDGPLYFAGEWRPFAMHPGAGKKPFMRPALDSRAQSAVGRVAEYVRHRLATKFGIDVPDAEPETD